MTSEFETFKTAVKKVVRAPKETKRKKPKRKPKAPKEGG
jgi:hypothetical protein